MLLLLAPGGGVRIVHRLQGRGLGERGLEGGRAETPAGTYMHEQQLYR
ncbi:MAG: hypothetical protein IT307_17245 [Chloroflexi bacterium]|nr:hypothetical protein [Chloroflexota bacterium]